MKLNKKILFILGAIPLLCNAEIRPILELTSGESSDAASESVQSFSSSNEKVVFNLHHTNPTAFGLFLGGEKVLKAPFSMQMGLGFYLNKTYKLGSTIPEAASSPMYQEKVFSKRYMLESKTLIHHNYPIPPTPVFVRRSWSNHKRNRLQTNSAIRTHHGQPPLFPR
jgi:hypothetical protein